MLFAYKTLRTIPFNKETIDSLIYRYAEKKAIDIGEIEDILKKEAIDRFLFREANVITSKNVSFINKAKHVGIIMDGNRRWAKGKGLDFIICAFNNVINFSIL